MEAKEEIKSRIDLADMIGEYVQLKPAGTHAFKALCPFHSEKTPSFHVSRDKQIWRCFGCGVGGDVFSFVMQMEGVDFPEALRILGKKAGVEIQRYDTSEANEKARAQRVQSFAAAYYHKMLLESPKAVSARAYMERRGITSELVEKFQLGFAPDEWDAFVTLAKSRGISDHDLSSGGLSLAKKSGSGFIDRFRNRLMIPLSDVHGNIVGFTGRVLNPDDQPKYMNSPETSLYKKSAILYGIHLAKQAIRRENAVIIVEGNLDVVASHKAGIEHVVASSGTALTELQIQLMKRFTTKLIFCFDADAAGFAAAQRGIQLAQKFGCDVSVVLIPEDAGKDPDDVVQKSPQMWRELARNTVPIMEYYFSHALRGKDLMKVDDKRAVGKFLLPEICRLTDVVEREHWLQKLGTVLHIETDVLRNEIGKSDRVEIVDRGGRGGVVISHYQTKRKKMRSELVLEELVGLFIEVPEFREEIKKILTEALIPDGNLKTLYRSAVDLYTQPQSSATQSFFEQLRLALSQELQLLLDEVALIGEQATTTTALTDLRKQFVTMIDVLRQAVHDDERRVLLSSIRQAEAAGDVGRVGELMRQLHESR
ncbi:MAG: DNA primase [Patescibacteria group bacterium]